ncbi:MAG: response regulator [Methanobacteriota archaeon]|nr:MAG: response regulator [Euryarchaeota archaeon]
MAMGSPEKKEVDRAVNFFGVLSHEIRARILEMLFENTELTYTEILNALGISDGKLNFHLRKMGDLIVSEEGKYRLSQLGLFAHKYLSEIRSEYGFRPATEEKRILIIDDDAGMCETLSDIFEKKGYMTDSAQTGEAGLEKVRERFYHVALIDIKLPDMEGTEVLERLKTISPHTIAIIITAFASLQNSIEALNKGAYAYILKPIDIDKVLETIRKALKRQQVPEEERGPVFKLASLRARLLATLIDAALIVISTGSILFFYVHLVEAMGFLTARDYFNVLRVVADSTLLYSNVFLGTWFLLTVLEGYRGETLGKYLLGLRVVKRDGSRITLADAAVRNIGKVFLLPIDLLLGLRYRKHGYVRFFDYYTRSTVVRTGEAAGMVFPDRSE